jgi:hypothetical protein
LGSLTESLQETLIRRFGREKACRFVCALMTPLAAAAPGVEVAEPAVAIPEETLLQRDQLAQQQDVLKRLQAYEKSKTGQGHHE